MQTPWLTVVTASFNMLDELRQTVDSVALFAGHGVEHVIVDGGSSDGTKDFLASLAPAVCAISEPDDGIADALNKGVAVARGEWILVLQAGDTFVDGEVLERIRNFLTEPYDIVAFDVVLTRSDGSSSLRKAREFEWLSEFKMTCPHQGMFCRRTLYERIGGFDTSFKIAMDFDWFLRAKRAGAQLRAVSMTVALMPQGGVSTKRDWSSIRDRLREDRRLIDKNVRNQSHRLFINFIWLVYLPFKRLRCAIETGR